jgi:hypothetical protein
VLKEFRDGEFSRDGEIEGEKVRLIDREEAQHTAHTQPYTDTLTRHTYTRTLLRYRDGFGDVESERVLELTQTDGHSCSCREPTHHYVTQ